MVAFPRNWGQQYHLSWPLENLWIRAKWCERRTKKYFQERLDDCPISWRCLSQQIKTLETTVNNNLNDNFVSNEDLNTFETKIKRYVDDQDKLYDGSVNDLSTRLSTTNANLKNLKDQFTALTSENVDGTINTYKEVEKFLKNINDTTTLI